MSFFSRLGHTLKIALLLFLAVLLMGSSIVPPGDQTERVRAFTRQIEFNYVDWILGALGEKIGQSALGTSGYLTSEQQHRLVIEYLKLVSQIQTDNAKINDIFADPKVSDPHAASAELRQELQGLQSRRNLLAPVVESILQNQVSTVVAEMGLTLGGQPIPPILFHSTPLPMALIISPRDVIRQEDDISLLPDLSVDQSAQLEDQVDRAMNVSSLVVPIGGVGVYPTMVQQTSDLDWLSEVISHEWTHNFLELRPLGLNYMTSPQLRIMNETTASIAGKEIGRAVIGRYYPELLPPTPSTTSQPQAQTPQQPAEPVFNFNAEMRITRVKVDQLLADGQIKAAEDYMEMRRVFFWDHGYHIRKLNQAYFAFYGAYADQPGGAAGEDPVGAAVRALRAQSPDLDTFLNRISWMWSFDQLQKAVSGNAP